MRHTLTLGIALAALTSCQGAPASTPHPRGGPPSPSASVATSATPVPVARCHTLSLAVGHQDRQAAAGTIVDTMTLTNISLAPCTLYGSPGLQMLDAGGNALPTRVVRLGGIFEAREPPVRFQLDPSARASFQLAWSDVPSGSTPCLAATQLKVTPPDETTFLVVAIDLAPCGPGGQIDVSPLVPA